MAVAALFSPYELARALFTINIGAGNQPCEYYAYFSLWGGFECDTVRATHEAVELRWRFAVACANENTTSNFLLYACAG